MSLAPLRTASARQDLHQSGSSGSAGSRPPGRAPARHRAPPGRSRPPRLRSPAPRRRPRRDGRARLRGAPEIAVEHLRYDGPSLETQHALRFLLEELQRESCGCVLRHDILRHPRLRHGSFITFLCRRQKAQSVPCDVAREAAPPRGVAALIRRELGDRGRGSGTLGAARRGFARRALETWVPVAGKLGGYRVPRGLRGRALLARSARSSCAAPCG